MLAYFCILTIDANSRRSNIGASSVASAPVAEAELQSGSRHCGKSATESERIVAPTLLIERKAKLRRWSVTPIDKVATLTSCLLVVAIGNAKGDDRWPGAVLQW